MRTWRISCHHLQAWAGTYHGGCPPTACYWSSACVSMQRAMLLCHFCLYVHLSNAGVVLRQLYLWLNLFTMSYGLHFSYLSPDALTNTTWTTHLSGVCEIYGVKKNLHFWLKFRFTCRWKEKGKYRGRYACTISSGAAFRDVIPLLSCLRSDIWHFGHVNRSFYFTLLYHCHRTTKFGTITWGGTCF